VGTYSIKEVETLSGLKAHTLRIWEQRYQFIEPKRTETNIRYYTDDQLRLILNVSFLNNRGLKISKLSKLSADEIAAEIEKYNNKPSAYDYYIHGLQNAMLEFNKVEFEQIISACIHREGILNTFSEIIIPFLERIGIMWTTGVINPAQEHFVSNLIRKKIIVSIDGLNYASRPNAPKFILFLPEGEWHEIPLLLFQYILKSRGYDVLYMGASLPLVDLKSSIKFIKPDYLASVITLPIPEFTVSEYFNIINSSFPGLKSILSGMQTANMEDEPENGILVMKNFRSLLAWCDAQKIDTV